MTKMMLCTVITTDEPLLLQIPGMLKVRHIGRTTLGSAGFVFVIFLGAGSLLRDRQAELREREKFQNTINTRIARGGDEE